MTRNLDQTGGTRGSRGQGLVEFAFVLPVLLLILLFAVDFGRAFFGYVILNNASRIAANYAALHPEANWASPSDPSRVEYEALIRRDTDVANCSLVSIPQPVYWDSLLDTASPDSTKDIGDVARVDIQCTFRPLTPIIGSVIGNSLVMSASSEFTVRAGKVTGVANPPPAPPPPPPCPAGQAKAPDLVNPAPETRSQAWNEWTAAGFTGSFLPNGQPNTTVSSFTVNALPGAPLVGTCLPVTSAVVVSP